MIQNQIKKPRWNYLALAFCFPVAGMMVYMLVAGCTPFGSNTMLYSDMYHQYFPFFKAFRENLLSGDSLLYSWDVGLGLDYLGLFAYYLASPLNLLSILVPEGLVLEYFALLVPIKLGLASLFFAFFLKKTFQKNDISIAVFGSFYGLCAWALGYQWNVMWLDSFALLPLVVLGTISLLRDRKFALYTLTLFASIFINYYIGFFICIFVFLLFVCYEITYFPGGKRFLQDLCRIALFSTLAIGMTAILSLPTLASLATTSPGPVPEGFKLNMVSSHNWKGLLDAMVQVAGNMSGGISPTFKEGLPNIYTGVLPLSLSFLFLMNKEIRMREKLCALGLLIFFMLSFAIRHLDYIWHGFHFPKMIPYRFSFLYSFVMLYMAYRAWLVRSQFKQWHIILAWMLTVAVFLCSKNRSEVGFIAYNFGFLTMYFLLLLLGTYRTRISQHAADRQRESILQSDLRIRRYATGILILVMGAELILNLVNFGLHFTTFDIGLSPYPKGTTYAESVIRYMHEREEDNLFFRAEMTHSQSLNDGALNGYNGITTFTSSANEKVTEFMENLGYAAKDSYNRYCYEEASPVSNLFLAVKYMIERDGNDRSSSYFKHINKYGNVVLLENNAYLPLGFLAEYDLLELDFDSSVSVSNDNRNVSVFPLQNRLFSAATGLNEDVWRVLLGESLTISGENVDIRQQTVSGYCSYSNPEDDTSGNLLYTYVVYQDGFMCVDFNMSKGDVYIMKNNVQLYKENINLQQTLAVGDVKAGDIIQIRIPVEDGKSGSATISAAILNPQRFWSGYSILAESTLDLTSFSNTRITGEIDCNRDGLLYTSIPQNGNWHVRVDGVEAEELLVNNVMLSVYLTEGHHELEFYYENPSFNLGWKISLLCGLVLLVLIVILYKPKFIMDYWKQIKSK